MGKDAGGPTGGPGIEANAKPEAAKK